MSKQGILYIPEYIYSLLMVRDRLEEIWWDCKPLYYSYKKTPHLVDLLEPFGNQMSGKKLKLFLFQEYRIQACLEIYWFGCKNHKIDTKLIWY